MTRWKVSDSVPFVVIRNLLSQDRDRWVLPFFFLPFVILKKKFFFYSMPTPFLVFYFFCFSSVPGRTRALGTWLRIFKSRGVGLDLPGLGPGTQQAEGAGEA